MPTKKKGLKPSAIIQEWSYLRSECRNLGLEDCYSRYCQRLQLPKISLLMGLEVLLMVTFLILLLNTVEDTHLIRPDIIVYVVSLILNLFLLKTNLKTDLKRRRPKLIFWLNFLVIFNIIFRDFFVLYYNYIVRNIFLACNYPFLVVIIIYLLLPVHGYLQPFLCAVASTITYDVMNTYIRLSYHDSFALESFVSFNVFNIGLHVMGAFDRLLVEYHARNAVLTRAKFVEKEIFLNLILKKEKIMMHTILPADIGHRLELDVKQRIKTDKISHNPSGILYVQPYENVSIMVANIMNFTQMTNSFSARSLVQILHELFVKIDLAAETHNVLAIKFVGDSYTFVAGIPYANHQHAKCAVNLSLDVIKIMREVCKNFDLLSNIRIGVHSGYLLSGIIGTVKWKYDIWSKDVDIAYRLEKTGRPGYVHISKHTYQLLDDQYIFEESTQSAHDDPILQKYHLTSYLIQRHRNSEETFQTINSQVPSSSKLALASRVPFAYNYELYSEEARVEALGLMDDQVKKMAIGRIWLARFFDFSDEPEKSKWEDFQFRYKLSPIFLTFRKRSDERELLSMPDVQVKYAVPIAAIIGLIIIFESIGNSTFESNVRYLVFLCSAILILSFIVLYGKLWLMIFGNSVNDRPTNVISKFLFNLSKWIERSLLARILIFLCLIGGTITMVSVLLINCGMKEFELNYVLADIEDRTPPHCFEPIVYTYSIVIVIMQLTIYPYIPYVLKTCCIFIILMTYLINVLGQYSIVFEKSRSTNIGLPAEYSHCWFVISATIVLFIYLRIKVYTHKLQFILKKELFNKEQQIEMANNSIKLMLNNIFPIHVADRYFNSLQSSEPYSEEFQNVAVMFASIKQPNLGQTSIRILNEIVCLFDSLLLKYDGKIEKIKVDNWTYLAACGLSAKPTERTYGIDVVYEGPKSDIGEYEVITSSSHFIRDNDDIVVLTMTQFAVDLLHIMHNIIESDLLLDSKLNMESGLIIGIAHGHVKAGVVGQWSTAYDIWGETVNMAAHLNAKGLLNKIQVPEKTANVLRSFNVRCKSIGLTFIRGAGAINSYLVALDKNFNMMPSEPREYELPTKIALRSSSPSSSIRSSSSVKVVGKLLKEDSPSASGSRTSLNSETSKNK